MEVVKAAESLSYENDYTIAGDFGNPVTSAEVKNPSFGRKLTSVQYFGLTLAYLKISSSFNIRTWDCVALERTYAVKPLLKSP